MNALALLILVLFVAMVCFVCDRRPAESVLTFADWWRELRIWFHARRAASDPDPYRSAQHTYRVARLRLKRKALMAEFWK